MKKKKIILGVTGSMAAYKSIELAKLLLSLEFEVTIILSKGAESFITAMTWRALFSGNVYTHDAVLENDLMLHISLLKDVDAIIIAPACVDFIAKLACGIADCLLSTICIAAKCKILIAPAANSGMWKNAIVQKNIAALTDVGVEIIGPEYGSQACGEIGLGRMTEVELISHFCVRAATPKLFLDKTILITSGATREKLDPVRFISNYSSGKMGYALALASFYMGAKVLLISSCTDINYPNFLDVTHVESADQMLKEALAKVESADIFIGCAAVADYKPRTQSDRKIKKSKDSNFLDLILEKNTDIIATVKNAFPHIFCLAFAAETDNVEEHGHEKLIGKNMDMIAINDVSSQKVFAEDHNELIVMTRDKKSHIPRASKLSVANSLLCQVHDALG